MIKRKTVHLKIECDAIMNLVYCQCAIISYIYLLLIFIMIQNDLILNLFRFRQLLSMDYYSLCIVHYSPIEIVELTVGG